jgi:hypothetical protein
MARRNPASPRPGTGRLSVVYHSRPRTGRSQPANLATNGKIRSPEHGPDWVLLLDTEEARYPLPSLAEK